MISEDELSICRGTWFEEGNWQPIPQSFSSQIEVEHLAKFKGEKLVDSAPDPPKGSKQGDIFLYNFVSLNRLENVCVKAKKLIDKICVISEEFDLKWCVTPPCPGLLMCILRALFPSSLLFPSASFFFVLLCLNTVTISSYTVLRKIK